MSDINVTITGGSASLSNSEIKTGYESNPDTNAFTDAEQTKVGYITVTQAVDLDQMETDIQSITNGVTYQGDWDASSGAFPSGANQGYMYIATVAGTVDSVVFDIGDKLIATVDSASTTTYADNWSKIDAFDTVTSVNTQIGDVVLDADDISDLATTNKFTTQADIDKLAGIESSATADQTGAEIKTLYEAEDNTNAFTDSEKSKLGGIEYNATADQSSSEIKSLYEANADTNAFTDAEKSKLAILGGGENQVLTIGFDSSSNYTCDGTADDVQIQEAIDSLNALGGGTLYFKQGTYSLSSTVTIYSNIRLLGENKFTTKIRRASDIDMIKNESEVSGVTIENLNFNDDSFANETIFLTNINNTNNEFVDLIFEMTGGRCLYLNGDFKLRNIDAYDVRQFLGTLKISNDTRDPYMVIENCHAKSITQVGGSEPEGIEINVHGDGFLLINDCTMDGFYEQLYEFNVRRFAANNCVAIMPSNSSSAGCSGFSNGIDSSNPNGDWTTGCYTNCHVRNLSNDFQQYGFKNLIARGISHVGCTVTGNGNTGTSIGFFQDGGAGTTAMSMIGCTVYNVGDPFREDTPDNIPVLVAHKFINCGDTNVHGCTTYS